MEILNENAASTRVRCERLENGRRDPLSSRHRIQYLFLVDHTRDSLHGNPRIPWDPDRRPIQQSQLKRVQAHYRRSPEKDRSILIEFSSFPQSKTGGKFF